MFKKEARQAFEDHLKQAEAMLPSQALGAEMAMGLALGMVQYASLVGDISTDQVVLLQHRVRAVRSRRIVALCQDDRRARA